MPAQNMCIVYGYEVTVTNFRNVTIASLSKATKNGTLFPIVMLNSEKMQMRGGTEPLCLQISFKGPLSRKKVKVV